MKSRDQILLEEAYQRILESPIADINQTSSIFDRPRDKSSYKLMSNDSVKQKMQDAMYENPKYLEFLKSNLFKNVPHLFEIVMIDTAHSNLYQFSKAEKERMIGINPDTITVLIKNENVHPSSPWIIGHRIGHIDGWFKKSSSQLLSINASFNLMSTLHEYVQSFDPSCELFDSTSDKHTNDDMFVQYDIYSKLSNFKSVRDKNVGSLTEYFCELHAQYLTTGKITFNPGPEQSKKYSMIATNCMKDYYNRLKGCYGLVDV
jgi:hypothetical protein